MYRQHSRRGFTGLVAAVLLAAGVPLAACGSSGDTGGTQTIRFVWWGNEDRANATNKAIALFEQRNPNIHVQTEFSGYAAYVQKLTTEVAGGAAPDLVQLDRATFGEYQQKHVLTDLSHYQGQQLRTDKIPGNLLAGGKADGGLYAVPGGQTAQMVAYDPALLRRAGVNPPTGGWTWQQFTTDMEKVGSTTGEPGTTDFGWAVDWFDSWLHQRGKALYTGDGKLGFTRSDLVAFWNLTGDLRQHHGVSTPQATTRMDGSIQNSAMVTKQAASEFNYDSNLTSYVSSYSGQVAAAPLPSDGTSATDSGMAALPPVYYAVPRMSAHADAAVRLLDFLVNDPDAGKLLGTTRGLPPNTDVRSAICGAAKAGDKAVCDYERSVAAKLGSSQSWLWPSGSSAIKTDFQQVYDDVIFGRSSVGDAAARVISDAQQSLG
ncbi:MAG TPA: extracellular solute-binding protein [Pseudonocardiaceae bacterium]|nr:extracellular solute-binding protein [Pseudonocardiaceae bacterium]